MAWSAATLCNNANSNGHQFFGGARWILPGFTGEEKLTGQKFLGSAWVEETFSGSLHFSSVRKLPRRFTPAMPWANLPARRVRCAEGSSAAAAAMATRTISRVNAWLALRSVFAKHGAWNAILLRFVPALRSASAARLAFGRKEGIPFFAYPAFAPAARVARLGPCWANLSPRVTALHLRGLAHLLYFEVKFNSERGGLRQRGQEFFCCLPSIYACSARTALEHSIHTFTHRDAVG
jgi:hypothetical protein